MKIFLSILLVMFVLKIAFSIYSKYGKGISVDDIINMLESKLDTIKKLKAHTNKNVLNSGVCVALTIEFVLNIVVIFLAVKGLYII